jgi:flagellar biosynthesis GTPase FlhF
LKRNLSKTNQKQQKQTEKRKKKTNRENKSKTTETNREEEEEEKEEGENKSKKQKQNQKTRKGTTRQIRKKRLDVRVIFFECFVILQFSFHSSNRIAEIVRVHELVLGRDELFQSESLDFETFHKSRQMLQSETESINRFKKFSFE